MRRILGLMVVLALASQTFAAANITKANIIALATNMSRTIDTIADVVTAGKADLLANHTRAIAIADSKGSGDAVGNAILRDSVGLRTVDLARPFVEKSMRAMANLFRDPDLRPVGATGTSYTNFGAFCDGEFTASERFTPEFAQVWRSIFGNG